MSVIFAKYSAHPLWNHEMHLGEKRRLYLSERASDSCFDGRGKSMQNFLAFVHYSVAKVVYMRPSVICAESVNGLHLAARSCQKWLGPAEGATAKTFSAAPLDRSPK
jgi:hypothetical protein